MTEVLVRGTLLRKVRLLSNSAGIPAAPAEAEATLTHIFDLVQVGPAWVACECRLEDSGVLRVAEELALELRSMQVTFQMASEEEGLGAGAPSEALWVVADILRTEVFCADSNEGLLQWQQAWEVAIMGNSNGEAAPADSENVVGDFPAVGGEHHSREMRRGQPAGLTFTKSEEGTHCWWDRDASNFDVRQPLYSKKKQKGPSAPSFYECVGMDLFRADQKVDHVGHYAALPEWDVESPHPLVPKFIVLNAQVPQYAPKMRSQDDGATMHVVWYFALKAETAAAIVDGRPTNNALRCLMRFLDSAPEDPAWASRFKVIGEMGNLSLTGALGATIKTYNGKPVLLRRGVAVSRAEPTPEALVNITVNIHQFSFLSRKALASIQSRVKDMLVNFAVMIECRDEDELPECLLGSVLLRHMNPDIAASEVA